MNGSAQCIQNFVNEQTSQRFTIGEFHVWWKELYGDRASILRAAEAVLQTLIGWGIIKQEYPKARLFRARKPMPITSVAASVRLMESAVASAGKSLRLPDRRLWLFPRALANLSENALVGLSRFPSSVVMASYG